MTTQDTNENAAGTDVAVWLESSVGFYDDYRFSAVESADAIRTAALESVIRSAYRAPTRSPRRCTNQNT
ncbi:hypothetical protein NG697_12565 [Pseudarthrobacter sp. MDT3-26]|uniref:hypothetical protein n=1 Tax=Pseudarthrobacter raffinosi TaxID=2953651 RepID=UPI00208F41F4|nr:hypothetical protein [Pseudarthrobacter sp. MDT3-26]MCO4263745.1 hypothetical protein [Pseudarthrobacter sp. MDT3-26]